MNKTKVFNRSDVSQENQYDFPYHYIPSLQNGHFSQYLYWSFGFHYLGTLEYLLDVLNEEPYESLIDVGCGDGRFLREVKHRFSGKELIGVDTSARAISLARALNSDLGFECVDICSDEVPRKLLDVVTLVEVLEHIPVDSVDAFVAAFAGFHKHGGRPLLTVPHKNKPDQEKHYQHFDSATLIKCLEPHYKIERLVFIDKNSHVFKHVIHNLLENRLFILNNRFLLDLLFRIYRERFFFCDEARCGRICVVGRRK